MRPHQSRNRSDRRTATDVSRGATVVPPTENVKRVTVARKGDGSHHRNTLATPCLLSRLKDAFAKLLLSDAVNVDVFVSRISHSRRTVVEHPVIIVGAEVTFILRNGKG